MINFFSYNKFGLSALVYCFLSCQAAFADDTEVFFNSDSASASGYPNVLFVLDTSGTMNSNTPEGKKIEVLKGVLAQFFAERGGLNMGMAITSGPGGPIVYPVTNPDEKDEPIVLTRVSTANDDGVQTNSSVSLTTTELNPSASNKELIALRFDNVGIPQGATINNARLLFGSEKNVETIPPTLLTDPSVTTYNIYIQQVNGSAPALSATNNDISDRIPVGQTPVIWNAEIWNDPTASPTSPATYQSADFSSLLQTIVDNNQGLDPDAGWCGGNSMVVILEKTGTAGRPIMAYDQNPNFAPALRVDFDADIDVSQSGCYKNTLYKSVIADDNTADGNKHDSDTSSGDAADTLNFESAVAFSFLDIGIPQGAIIADAKIRIYPAADSKGQSKSATVSLINDVDPPVDSSVLGLTSPLTTTWVLNGWEPGTRMSSPNIAANIQTLVNNALWDETKDLSFKITGGSNKFIGYSFEGLPAQAPSIEITYVGRYSPSAATKRNAMIAAVEDFKATGNLQVASMFAEAGLYYDSKKVKYGAVRGSPTNRDARISHRDSVQGVANIETPIGCTATNPSATACKDERYIGDHFYQSPKEDSCQSNNIVLMLGRSPTGNMDSGVSGLYNTWVSEFNGDEEVNPNCTNAPSNVSYETNDDQENCTMNLAGLYTNDDVIPANTHTISFDSSNNVAFLAAVAKKGKGESFVANNREGLLEAFNAAADAIVNTNTTFVSAGVTVNQYNQLTHNDELYFSLFKPTAQTVWPGNVKRYQLKGGQLWAENDVPAVDVSGKFAANAQSWWSSAVDGNQVEQGGAGERLSADREVFSNLLGNTTNLKAGGNQVASANTANIPPALLGAGVDTARRDLLLDWIKGVDINNAAYPVTEIARQKMGDPLHSQPTLLTYANGDDTFSTVVFVGTNEGFLHSFDTATGDENWAFIPKDLLPRISSVVDNDETKHASYGLDSSVTLYIEDTDADGHRTGIVDPGEKAYLYIGMRRGGYSYYGLDVSALDSPTLMFKISSSDANYLSLGQTWSKPVIKKVKKLVGDSTVEDKLVMMFGGGYDLAQDTAGTAAAPESVGNNVYIADATDGTRIWSVANATQAGLTQEQVDAGETSTAGSLTTMNAVPNAIVAFDFNGDEYIDHFYASDTKAQVFRFDLKDDGQVIGGRVANMQNTATAANNRRFYNAPDIALIRLTSGSFVSISIGSGYRAHPLDKTVTDHFYVIKDKGIINNVFDMDADLASLADVTDLFGSSASTAVNAADINGWYIRFPDRDGEKVLSDSITFNNVVIFTTFTPPTPLDTGCGVKAGTSRLYLMSILDGNPYTDNNSDTLLTLADRVVDLPTEGIAPKPQILITPKPVLIVGTTASPAEPPKTSSKLMGVKWKTDAN